MVISDNPNHTKRRACTVNISNAACLIRKIYMEGNSIIGEIETLSNQKGQEIAAMITKDRVNIGVSLRALGGTNVQPDGTIEVTLPIKPITYDLVSNPSHANARILEFLPESVNDYGSGGLMYESVDDINYLAENDNVNFEEANNIQRAYVHDVINNNFKSALKQIKFKI